MTQNKTRECLDTSKVVRGKLAEKTSYEIRSLEAKGRTLRGICKREPLEKQVRKEARDL